MEVTPELVVGTRTGSLRSLALGPGNRFEGTNAPSVEEPASADQHNTEDQETDVLGDRCAEVVSHVMNPEDLVVYQAFDGIEDAPPGEQQPDVEAPVRG